MLGVSFDLSLEKIAVKTTRKATQISAVALLPSHKSQTCEWRENEVEEMPQHLGMSLFLHCLKLPTLYSQFFVTEQFDFTEDFSVSEHVFLLSTCLGWLDADECLIRQPVPFHTDMIEHSSKFTRFDGGCNGQSEHNLTGNTCETGS